MEKPWHLYILMDEKAQLYIGITQNLPQRIAKHRRANGTMHTAKLINPHCVYTESFPTRAQATAREKTLKHLPRHKKLALIASHQSPDAP